MNATIDWLDLFQNLPGYIYLKDTRLRYMACNRDYAHAFSRGYEIKASLNGKKDESLPWHKTSLAVHQKYDRQVLEAKRPLLKINEVINLTNGFCADILTNRYPIYHEDGSLAGILFVGIVNSQRYLDDQIFFQHMLNKLPYFIFWKNKQSIYLGCNTNFAKFLNSKKEKIVGLSDFDLGWGEGEAEIFKHADQKVLEGNRQINKEEVLQRPEGDVTMLVSKIPVKNRVNDTIGVLGISTDITRIKKFEQTLKVAKEEAEMANRAKSDFISSMSHDLRTPLSVIRNMIELLMIKNKHPEYMQIFETIDSASKNLHAMVEGILSYSQLENDETKLKFEVFSLFNMVDDLINIFTFQCKNKNLDLTVEYKNIFAEFIKTDPYLLHRILSNLITNAIKFTSKGKINILIETVGKINDQCMFYRFSVEDTGCGIHKNKLNVIFDRFTQLKQSYRSNYKGLGLGLSIVKKLVANLKGKITVKSKLDQGSIFAFEIPVEMASQKNMASYHDDSFKLLILGKEKNIVKLFENKKIFFDIKFIADADLIDEHYLKANGFDYHGIIINDDSGEKSFLKAIVKINQLLAKQHLVKIPIILYLKKEIKAQLADNIVNGVHLVVKEDDEQEIFDKICQILSDKKKQNKSQAIATKEKITILVVDDDPLCRLAIKLLLEELGIDVNLANNGAQAVAAAEKTYDIIFMDIGLPDEEGPAVSMRIRKEHPNNRNTPIIALTAHMNKIHQHSCLSKGMNGFLTKPAKFNEIKEILKKHTHFRE